MAVATRHSPGLSRGRFDVKALLTKARSGAPEGHASETSALAEEPTHGGDHARVLDGEGDARHAIDEIDQSPGTAGLLIAYPLVVVDLVQRRRTRIGQGVGLVGRQHVGHGDPSLGVQGGERRAGCISGAPLPAHHGHRNGDAPGDARAIQPATWTPMSAANMRSGSIAQYGLATGDVQQQ